MIHQVKKSAAAIQAAKSSSFVNDMIKFAKQAVSSKEMWLMVIAGIICIILVYTIRRAAMAHAWKAASVAGALAYLIVATAGGSVLSVKTSTTTLFVGAVVAVVIGLVLEIIFFAVDYSKCESLQFEDDEYYYYVKAVPKFNMTMQEVKIKKISGNADEIKNEYNLHAAYGGSGETEPEDIERRKAYERDMVNLEDEE